MIYFSLKHRFPMEKQIYYLSLIKKIQHFTERFLILETIKFYIRTTDSCNFREEVQ